jgi:hypothetical protein
VFGKFPNTNVFQCNFTEGSKCSQCLSKYCNTNGFREITFQVVVGMIIANVSQPKSLGKTVIKLSCIYVFWYDEINYGLYNLTVYYINNDMKQYIFYTRIKQFTCSKLDCFFFIY